MSLARVRYADLVALPSLDEIKARKAAAKAAKEAAAKADAEPIVSNTKPVDNSLSIPVDNRLLTPGNNSLLSPVDNRLESIGVELWIAEGADGVFTVSRISRIKQAQDALTHREEKVYDVLWGQKTQSAETSRLSQMGYSELARKSRVDRRTVIRLVDRLLQKGYIHVEAEAVSRTSTPSIYRVMSYGSVLKFQKDTGRSWILKTGTGVFYARRMGNPVDNSPSSPGDNMSSPPDVSSAPPPGTTSASPPGVSGARYKKDSKEGITSSSDTAVVQRAIAKHLAIDDAAVHLIIEGCRRNDPDCNFEEIAEFAAFSAGKIRQQGNVKNPAGLLINQAPKFFPGAELTAYRARKAREHADRLEMAQRVLSDPESPEDAKEWARTFISDGRQTLE
jgi:hypothetical protein